MREPDLSAFDTFPILKTARLTLRDIRQEDVEPIFRMRASGRVNQFIARPDMSDRESAVQLIERITKAYADRNAIAWAGILRNGGEIIGTCGLKDFDLPNRRAEIGGELDVNHWGKRIAVEAVQAITDFGLEVMGLHTIEAKVDPDNRGAIALLEHLGFIKEAHFTQRVLFGGRYRDLAVYTLMGK